MIVIPGTAWPIGRFIALLVLIAVFVLWLVGGLSLLGLAAMVAALALALLL